MELTVAIDGTATDPVPFSCSDTFGSRWAATAILAGNTYPHLPFVDDVRVIFDIGANCGAATRYLAHHHPTASIHAFEPAQGPRRHLERNVAHLDGVHVHPVALGPADAEVPLYLGLHDDITASTTYREGVNVEASELVQVRDTSAWLAEHGIDRIDIVKLDVEGAEVEILRGLVPLLPTTKVLYVEYDSRDARRELDRLLEPTHELYAAAFLTLDQGECTYVRKDVADHPEAKPFLLRRFLSGATT